MPWWGSNTPKEVKEIDESVIIEDITITATALGRGSYGSVFAAVYEGKPCVAKEMHPHLSDSDKQNYPTGFSPRDIFIKEINTLYKLKHPSIVQFLGVYFKEESFVPILVMERLWINVSTLLHKRRNQVPLFAKARILHDVACGLQYLHNQKKPVIHRDINANNILLNEFLEAKIADLGQAKALENVPEQKLTAAPGNLAHMPPETLKDKPIYDTKLDVFSFGCTVIHTVTEKFPKPTKQFVESEESNSYIKVSEYKRREEYFDLMNSNLLLRRIAKDCLEDVPTNRPTALFICGELEKYIEELEETKSQKKLAEQHKKDKLSLITEYEKDIKELSTAKMLSDNTILKLEEELSLLKSHFQESKEKLLKCKQENQSLQKKVANQDEINKQLTISHNNQMDRLKEDLTAKQDEMQKEINHLKNSLEDKESMFSQQDIKVSSLEADLSNLKKSVLMQKQQLEDRSYRMSALESSYNALQQSLESSRQKLKPLEEQNSNLTQLLDYNDRLLRTFKRDLNDKKESLKRKEEELKLQKKEHADTLNNLRDQHEREMTDLKEDIKMYKSQADRQEEVIDLLRKEAQLHKSEAEKITEDKLKMTENELSTVNKEQRHLKRRLKQLENDIKGKTKCIETLNKNAANLYSNRYTYHVHWYPCMSLPVKKVQLSVANIKGKMFITGGYLLTSPQDKQVEPYLQSPENTNTVFCFYPEKYQCNAIDSPVQLGALASVNGQCVLVSGADSVGNTLTGNVYVLCEEGSHDQWKEFSKPLPTPRILACAYCYVNRWLIICGGFTSKSKEESSLLEAVSVVEILDITKGEWYTLSEKNCPNFSIILCCAVVGEDVYVVGSDQVIKTSCNKLIKAATSNNTLVWDNVQIETEESNKKLYPFSVVEVNGEPMIIASMTDGEDDVTCVLMKDTRRRWRIMSKTVECQHCSGAVVTSSLELLLFGGSEKISVIEATDISQKATLIPTLNMWEGACMTMSEETKSSALDSLPFPITTKEPNGGMMHKDCHNENDEKAEDCD